MVNEYQNKEKLILSVSASASVYLYLYFNLSLSALRFVALSRGAQSHTPMPALATQLMSGVANMRKDAVQEALKCRR